MPWGFGKRDPVIPVPETNSSAPTPTRAMPSTGPSTPATPMTAKPVQAVPGTSESRSPVKPAPTQLSVADREMNDLREIIGDGEALRELAREGLENDSLQEQQSLERLTMLSGRLLNRGRARKAAQGFVERCLDKRAISATQESLEAALKTIYPAYFRHSAYNEAEGKAIWLSKGYLYGLPGSQDGAQETTLSVRFSLGEFDGAEERTYDLQLQLLQVHPFVTSGPRFAFTFSMQDAVASEAGGWTLDEVQRGKLLELHALLGLRGAWTPPALLGMMLSAVACGELDSLTFFTEVVGSARDAHREELLEQI